MGRALEKGRLIDIEAELELANEVKEKLVTARSGAPVLMMPLISS